MIILQILLLFLLLPNILLLFLLKKDFASLGKRAMLLISYGLAPLINGLVFYYLLSILPAWNSWFYIATVLVVWMFVFFVSRGKLNDLLKLYKGLVEEFKNTFSGKKLLFVILLFIVTLIYSVQAFVLPVAENDSAYYYVSSEALFQSKDAKWTQNGSIVLRGLNQYPYNQMVRPGIPSAISFTFLFGDRNSNYSIYNFFFVFYYYLLLGAVLLLVSKLAQQVKKDQGLAQVFALAFFTFYWNMTRFYIFNNKEVAIFFFALMGIYLVYDLIEDNSRSFKKELLLGAVIGANAFINYHGTVIGVFLLAMLLVFSKLPFWQRFRQVLVVFVTHLFFSSFEIINTFGSYIWGMVRVALHLGPAAPQVLSGDETLKAEHIEMYQANSIVGMYLKGKLQLITGVGSYGFYFLFFLAVVARKFKEIVNSLLGKITLTLIAAYYLFVIDPFNLNRSDLSVVLWGSPKYSMFVVLLAVIFVAVYFEAIVRLVFNFIYKHKVLLSSCLIALAAIFLLLKSKLISLGLSALFCVVEANREFGFYLGKITLLYYLAVIFFVLFAGLLLIFRFKRIAESLAFKSIIAMALIFMIAPFFIVDPGKVPLYKTFGYVGRGLPEKLQNVIYFGDEYKVYYYATTILPKDTAVRTGFTELYTYNDYFRLMNVNDKYSAYEITGNCSGNQEIFNAGAYRLCKITKKSTK